MNENPLTSGKTLKSDILDYSARSKPFRIVMVNRKSHVLFILLLFRQQHVYRYDTAEESAQHIVDSVGILSPE